MSDMTVEERVEDELEVKHKTKYLNLVSAIRVLAVSAGELKRQINGTAAAMESLTARVEALEKASVPAGLDATEPEAPVFKPGDRVRCVDAGHFPIKIGDQYTVAYCFLDAGRVWRVDIEGFPNHSFLARRFELVTAAAEAPVPDPQAAKGAGMSPEYYCEWVRENFASAPPYRCGACANLLWKMLTLSGYKAECRTGKVQGIGHVWVNCEGKILDPTDAQFSEPIKYPHGELFVDDPQAAKGEDAPPPAPKHETWELPANWQADVEDGIYYSRGVLTWKHPERGVVIMSIEFTDEIFACILTRHQAYAIARKIGEMFGDWKHNAPDPAPRLPQTDGEGGR